MKRRGTFLGGLAITVVMVLTAPTISNAQYSIPRSVIGSGGTVGATGGGLTMGSTIGQPVIGWVNGGGMSLHQGFWYSFPNGTNGVDYSDIKAVAGAARNLPNPFSTSTTILYSIAERSDVHLTIYSASGEIVRHLVSGLQESGEQRILWDGLADNGERVAAGMYVFAIDARSGRGAETFSARGKMLMVR